MNYYDSARRYSDSEEKLGEAFGDMWDKVTIATKIPARSVEEFWNDGEDSVYRHYKPPS